MQLIFLYVSSLLIIIYVIKVRPLSTLYLNGIEIFNEFMFYICSCAIIAFTDIRLNSEVLGTRDPAGEEEMMRTYVGWGYIGVTGLVIVISMGGLIIICLRVICSKINEKCE